MNTKNNKRRRESMQKMEREFVNMLLERDVSEITVSDICKAADVNRSTFYANYQDIYDLVEKICLNMQNEFNAAFEGEIDEGFGALKMFTHIYENQLFYKIYFLLEKYSREKVMVYDKLRAEQDFQNQNVDYHIEFFRSGFNAIVKMWLDRGCRESPEEMAKILESEYMGRR